MATDATWRELTEVCLLLGHRDESLLAFAKIADPRLRREAEHLLQRRGILEKNRQADAADEAAPRSIKDDVLDATRVLFEDHMPLTTIVTTMTFPIVVGLGGFLTASTSSSVLFPAIAALPALCVAAVVGGMSRRILIDAARGIQDPPRIPQVRELSRQSGRFLLDALALGLVLLGPALLLALAQGPTVSTIVAAALGAFLLPGAMTIRQLTDDWRALSPHFLFVAITRLRGDYAACAAICTLVSVPAALAAIFTAGSHLYLQASVVGPLAVAPLFFASRLLGLVVYGNRHDLREVLAPDARRRRTLPAPSVAPVAASALRKWPSDLARPTLRMATAAAPRVNAAPAAPRAETGPLPTSAPRPKLQSEPRTRRPDVQAAPRPLPPLREPPAPRPSERMPQEPNLVRTIAGRGPRPQPPVAPQTGAGGPQRQTAAATSRGPGKPAPAPEPAAEAEAEATLRKRRVEITGEAPPDFTQMPGFNVVTGAARVLSGAASRAGSKRR